MIAKTLAILLCLLGLFASGAAAQGFAGLGRAADGFTLPERGYAFQFPKDHGAHPGYQIEWWYLTANLKDETGRDLGIQWTLFRSALAPEEGTGWDSPQLWLAHAAITTPEAHFVAERRARGGIGQAGVRVNPFEAWIDDWSMSGDDMDRLTLSARGQNFSYELSLDAEGPPVFHGEAGYSQKSDSGRASYSYSQPVYTVAGPVMLPSGPVEVTGHAWLDREWASQPLAATQVSWDWFSMVFDSGARLMGFTLHDSDGSDYTSATWIDPDGRTQAYPDGAFKATALETTRVAGRDVPTRWRAELPERGVDVTVQAINGQAWMDTTVDYWEGPVRISGTHAGRGYLEMTGY